MEPLTELIRSGTPSTPMNSRNYFPMELFTKLYRTPYGTPMVQNSYGVLMERKVHWPFYGTFTEHLRITTAGTKSGFFIWWSMEVYGSLSRLRSLGKEGAVYGTLSVSKKSSLQSSKALYGTLQSHKEQNRALRRKWQHFLAP